jgi:hypothetical protein
VDYIEENVQIFTPEEYGMIMSLIQDRDEEVLKFIKLNDKKKIVPL